MTARALAQVVAGRLRDVCGDDSALEAEVLVRHAAGLRRAEFFSGAPADAGRVDGAIERRLAGEPLAYITGTREFFGLEFAVTSAVLIPRPETELLVELALREAGRTPNATVVDVGTGSGCIAISIATNRTCQGRTVMIDVSREALDVAMANAAARAARCEPGLSNLGDAVARADIVVANLPYVPSGEIPLLQREVRDWEPRLALDGGRDGLQLLARLIRDCGARIRPRLLLLEVGFGQATAVRGLLAENEAVEIDVHRDLAGIERVVAARWPQE